MVVHTCNPSLQEDYKFGAASLCFSTHTLSQTQTYILFCSVSYKLINTLSQAHTLKLSPHTHTHTICRKRQIQLKSTFILYSTGASVSVKRVLRLGKKNYKHVYYDKWHQVKQAITHLPVLFSCHDFSIVFGL